MKIKKKNDFNRMLNYLKAEILEKYTKEKRKQNCLQISGQLASKVDEKQQQSTHFILNTSAKKQMFRLSYQ